jgi:hypothetical protein
VGLWSDLLARFAGKHDGWRPRPQASLYVRDGGIFIFSARASSAGRYEEAAVEFRDMLRLNPNDNQGNRYHLARCAPTSGGA